MRWTPERLAEFRALVAGGKTEREIGDIYGISVAGVASVKTRYGIYRRDYRHDGPGDDEVRARWAELIGPMKERLRAEIGGM